VRYKGKRLDEFIELRTIEGLMSGDTFELVEEPYSQRDAQLHVQRLRDLVELGGALSRESPSLLSSLTQTEGGCGLYIIIDHVII